jgi:hypothetical protein
LDFCARPRLVLAAKCSWRLDEMAQDSKAGECASGLSSASISGQATGNAKSAGPH